MARDPPHTIELPAISSFLVDLTLEATNWRAEQAPRPAVVNRKVQAEIDRPVPQRRRRFLSSVIQTARPRDMIVDLLRAPQPTMSPALACCSRPNQSI